MQGCDDLGDIGAAVGGSASWTDHQRVGVDGGSRGEVPGGAAGGGGARGWLGVGIAGPAGCDRRGHRLPSLRSPQGATEIPPPSHDHAGIAFTWGANAEGDEREMTKERLTKWRVTKWRVTK